jgi:hypothetical protein
VASANRGVGRELADTIAVMKRELRQTHTGSMPQMFVDHRIARKGDSFNSRRTDGRPQGRPEAALAGLK